MLELMEEVYLWEQHIPDTLDVRYEFDEFEFLKSSATAKKTAGPSLQTMCKHCWKEGGGRNHLWLLLAFGTFSNTDNYFAIVQYVYPDTPAWKPV